LNPNQNPAVNWTGVPSNSFSTSPATAVYNQSNIPSQSPGGTGQLASWNGAAGQTLSQNAAHGSTVLVPNLYNPPTNNHGNSQYANTGGFFNHQSASGPHSASFSSSGSPMMNTNLSLGSASMGVTPTTPQIANKNLAINPSHQDPNTLPGGPNNPANGAMSPGGSQAGSPGSLVGGNSESVSASSHLLSRAIYSSSFCSLISSFFDS
jgi:hypothetical protein